LQSARINFETTLAMVWSVVLVSSECHGSYFRGWRSSLAFGKFSGILEIACAPSQLGLRH